VILAIPLAIAGDQSIRWSVKPAIALVILGVVGTGLAYVINFALIASEGASVATYLVPVTAALLGVAVVGEQCTGSSSRA